MIEAAERAGKLRHGGTIVEPTSGNTGVGLAHRRRPQGLPLHLRHARQGVAGEDPPAARLRRRGRRLPDGRRARVRGELLLRLEPPRARRSRARSSPTSTRTRPTRRRTTRRPGPRSGSRRAARSTRSSLAVGTGGTITGAARYLRERKPRPARRRRRSRGLDLLVAERAPVPRRGHRRGLLAVHVRPARSSTST